MVSAVKSRPNHYELLGLTPRAAGAAIAEAFARATSVLRPHAFGGTAELCVAYETLRDPARRRAYDASIGLEPEPLRLPPSRPISAHFMAQPSVSGPLVEPMVELAAAEPVGEPKATEPAVEPEPAEPIVRPPIRLDTPAPLQPAPDEINVGVRSIEWKRTGAVVGGLVAAAVLVGALAGWWSSGSASEPAQVGPPAAATQEKAPPSFSELWRQPAPDAVEVRTNSPLREPDRRVERSARRPQLAASEAEAQLIQPPPDLADPAPGDPLAPETAPAPPVAATMPLPHQTVARTLDRIGYRCGGVASATLLEGTTGVYKVNCTSGQSFQAKPVHGRYRFRRLARN